jgi:hypothetical protein
VYSVKIRSPVSDSTARIAFVLQTHKCLDQIEHLIRTLRGSSTNHIIIVSHDGPPAEIGRLARLDGVTKASAAMGGRGSFGLVGDFLASVRWLQGQALDYDWIVMMSGQDYLVRPLSELEDKLAASQFDGYYHHFRANDPTDAMAGPMQWSPDEGRERYHYSYRILRPNIGRLEQILLKLPKDLINRSRAFRLSTSYGLILGRLADNIPFGDRFDLIGGSFWMTIRRACADYLTDYVARNPEIEEFYRKTLVPDESFVHSILHNSRKFSISREELRFYDFSRSRHGRPRIIDESDLPRLTRSGYYIARKFDVEKHPGILERIDEAIALRPARKHDRDLSPPSFAD